MASYAAAIRDEIGVDAEIELGKRGQFDVYVDERRVVSRKGGLMALLTKKPWPSEASVVEAIKSSLVC